MRVPGCARHLGPGVQVPSRAGPIRCFLKLEERAVGLGVRLWPCDSLVQNFHTVQPPARVLLPPLRWADGRSSLFLGASGCCLSRFHLGQTLLCRSPRSPSSDPVKCRAWACRRPVSTLGLCVHTCAHALHACVQWARQPWSPIHPDPGAGAPFQALTQSLGWKEGVGGVLPFVLLARHSRTFHRKRSSVAARSVRYKDHREPPPGPRAPVNGIPPLLGAASSPRAPRGPAHPRMSCVFWPRLLSPGFARSSPRARLERPFPGKARVNTPMCSPDPIHLSIPGLPVSVSPLSPWTPHPSPLQS